MGLLSAVPEKGAIRAGPNAMIGSCQPPVKRKRLVIGLYLPIYKWVSGLCHFRPSAGSLAISAK